MKVARLLGVVAVLVSAAGAAWAGGGCCGADFGCQNKCPMAQEASQHRSYGTECEAVCRALADEVEKNLAKV